MRRPLYRIPGETQPTYSGHGHRGLWYDKFCDRWDGQSWTVKATEESSPKLDWVRTVTSEPAGVPEELDAYARRLEALVHARGGTAVVVTAQSRFVTGLGRSHPVENGFTWHPTLGTPYLAGSSVKGIIRAWAEENHKEEVTRLLGNPDEAGAVAFLDAVPLRPVGLEADVLTPHYANWTQDEPPGDWCALMPVPFLVAAPGLSLLCGIVPLRSPEDGDLAMVRSWLTVALDGSGAGAKTAVGYGHFQEDTRDTTLARWQEERRRREARATPEGWWRDELESRSEQDILDAVRTYLVNETPPDSEDRRAFVRAVLDTGMVMSWKRGEKTDTRTTTGDKKLREYARAVFRSADEFGIQPPQ